MARDESACKETYIYTERLAKETSVLAAKETYVFARNPESLLALIPTYTRSVYMPTDKCACNETYIHAERFATETSILAAKETYVFARVPKSSRAHMRETSAHAKRPICMQRDLHIRKETHRHAKRPTNTQRDLHTRKKISAHAKRPTCMQRDLHTRKETDRHGKRPGHDPYELARVPKSSLAHRSKCVSACAVCSIWERAGRQ